jgi:ribonuclease P protein component
MSDSVSPSRQTFRKTERLCSRKILEDLSSKGKRIQYQQLRLVWSPATFTFTTPVQAAFTVPKKNFKHAVIRNRIKRRMKEAYRKNKSSLYSLISQKNLQFALLFVFTGKEILTYSDTEQQTTSILKRLAEDIQKNYR